MIVKRYYVDEMSEAMGIIKAELGSDAVILSSKQVRQKGLLGFFKKRQFEVTAAYEPRLESPKAREERENAAYAAAIKAAAAQREQERAVPPSPGRPVGPIKPDPVEPPAPTPSTSASRAAAAYRTASATSGSGQSVSTAPSSKEALSAQEALAAALASRQNNILREQRQAVGRQEPPEEEAPPPIVEVAEEEENAPVVENAARAEAVRREQDHFIPYAPPEMVITPPQREEPPSPLELLDRKIDAVAAMMDQLVAKGGTPQLTDEGKQVESILLAADVESTLARQLAEEAQQVAPRIGGDAREAAFRLVLRELRESKPLAFQKGKRSVVLFMGPTGVGKTTTLVKLATMCSVRQGLKVGMINTDTYRIAAQEQLKIYADILAVNQSVIFAPEEMTAALEEMEDRDVVFVDTAGKRPGDAQHVIDMQALMDAAGEEACALLCVAATTGPRSLRAIIDHYSFLRDYGLVLTKIDETQGLGAALTACAYAERPLNYLTSGQSVPDDIEEADAREIARRITA